jgi:cobalt-precorrin-5B (C1)-methyltransferase
MSEAGATPPGRPLRRGWTTGACAAAAAKAAATALLTGAFPDPVTIRLPGGQTPAFALARESLADDIAEAGIVKDAGDDPDVTHGALVVVRVRRAAAGAGIVYRAGVGVGTVTRPGLPVPVGEPAINPAPRRMIAECLAAAGLADAEVEIGIPDGELLARQTMNGRLGIVGGLSILGTTGIVVPYSCAAWIASIHQGIDVARAAGLSHVAAATGRASEAAVQAMYGLPETALIDMGDFAGATLKHLRRHPVARLSIAGGFGKLSKLAAGEMDLHSARSRVDPALLAGLLAELGADRSLRVQALAAHSAAEVLRLAQAAGLPLADQVAARARAAALAVLAGGTVVEVLVFDREGALLGRA